MFDIYEYFTYNFEQLNGPVCLPIGCVQDDQKNELHFRVCVFVSRVCVCVFVCWKRVIVS